MQDRALVAAIVAGDSGGLGEAYDRYAAPLYAYCRSILPGPDGPDAAASAVTDTFIIATARLQALRDPGQLGPWLHAVARNECLRRPGALDQPVPAAADGAGPPDGLREQVLAACGDSTPAGRANRVSVVHRAGSFGRNGFPKPVVAAGPRWWHAARRRPWAAAGVAVAAAAVVAGGVVALALTGGTHGAAASTVALGGGGFGTSSAASGAAGARSSPGAKPAAAPDALRAPASRTPSPTSRASSPGPSRPAPRSAASSPGSTAPASPSPSPSSPASSQPPGTLAVAPAELTLSARKNTAVSGTFLVTAVGGPVDFSISSASAKVTVSPKSGSLASAGSWKTVTVTAKSPVALRTTLTVNPGHLVVTVVLTIKA